MPVTNLKHGENRRGKKSPEYHAWGNMHQRCGNPNNTEFRNYGGRGITVHKRWQKFENFLEDMGRKPSPKHSLDRKINDFPYSPLNCRWATRTQQRRNQRPVKLTLGQVGGVRFLHLFGFSQTEIGKKFNIDRSMVSRIVLRKNWI
jgi:hypothetical protein